MTLALVTSPATVAKGDFARMCGVTPGRVSQWISERKIHGDAIDGEGRSAKIVVDVARQQLRRSIDVGQRFGNGINTDLGGRQIANAAGGGNGGAAPAAAAKTEPLIPKVNTVEDQIVAEKLREIQIRNRRATEEERARAGLYVDAGRARKAIVETVDQLLKLFEGGIADIASALAAEFEIPQRDITHRLKLELRKVREKVAAQAANRSRELAPTEVVEVEEEPA